MKISKSKATTSVTYKTTNKDMMDKTMYKWFKATNQEELKDQTMSTVAYLKMNQQYRFRQIAMFARLYGNKNLFNFAGSSLNKIDAATGLPADRPTFNLIQSATDSLVATITQSRPSPIFLTNAGDYKQRKLSKQLTEFVGGEFYETKAYEKAADVLRDAIVMGTGCMKVYEDRDGKIALDRVLLGEIFVDENEAIYGEPRQMFQMKLMDRSVLGAITTKRVAEDASNAYPDNGANASIADQVMVIEAWHLPSSKDAKDGRHVIVCDAGVILDEPYEKESFPFIFVHYSKRMLGFWSQGLAEQLMGSQIEINAMLATISRAIRLVGVPRVFVEMGSKVNKTSFNNEVGSIIEYSGVKPIYEVAPTVPAEMYSQLETLIQRGYQQCGVSQMQAGSQKPAGLDSGEAIRTYDDIQTNRLSTISRAYDNMFIELAEKIVDLAKDISIDKGKYSTVYPGKDLVREVDLPGAEQLMNPFVVQIFNQSSLPKDPAGRLSKITEMLQAGMISIKEGRRLLGYPDIDQMEKLDIAAEERIFQTLDKIVEDGVFTPPDPFMDLQLATELTTKYYNLYGAAKLDEDKLEMLRVFFAQVQALIQQSMPPQPAAAPAGGQPMAAPQPQAVSNLVPNGSVGGTQ